MFDIPVSCRKVREDLNVSDFSEIQSAVPELDPVHDGRHDLADNPYARESIPYVIVLADEGIVANSYTWVDREGQAGGIFFLFGPGLKNGPVVELFEPVKVPADQNFDDWKVGGLNFRQDLALRHADVSVQGEKASIEFHFEAIHPAYAYGFHPKGCPAYIADNRTEQAGRVKGVLKVEGREIQFDTTGVRDHSWGTRDWKIPQHWKWMHAQAGPDVAVHVFQIQALGGVETRGYVFRDRLFAEVRSAEFQYTTTDDFYHSSIVCTIQDSAHRTTVLEGKCFGHHAFLPNPETTLNQGAMNCSIEGIAGSGYIEFLWPTGYLEHLRSVAIEL